jgi:pyruvate/2-oxoglutarate dehydrogenase complex dihydrolipoamide acyltransferase (E2) component
MKARNNEQLAHLYASGNVDAASANNFYFEFGKLYSYGSHFCIARRLARNVYAYTTQTYGPATSKHLAYARRALSHATVWHVEDPAASATDNKAAAVSEVMRLLDEAGTTRRIKDETRDRLRGQALNVAEQFNGYLAAMPEGEREGVPPFDLEDAGFIALREAREAAKRAEEEAKEKARQQAAMSQAERLAAWKRGEQVQGSMHALPVALRLAKSRGTHHTGGLLPDMGSVGREVIQTSHGAEVPLSQALALWPIIQRVHGGITSPAEALRTVQRVGVYNVTAFEEDGAMRIGCHSISYESFADMAARLVVAGLLSTEDAHTRPAIGFKRVRVESARLPVKYARWDGLPKRCPRKGELYLSGAVVVAYRAKADMTTPYFIATECQE